MIRALPFIAFFLSLPSFGALGNGLYAINGTDSVYGPYHGQLQIRGTDVLRIVRFDNQIETVWQGQLQNGSATFQLRPSQALTSLNDFTVSDQEFSSPQTVVIPLQAPNATFSVEREGKKSETYSLQTSDAHEPIWQNERTERDALGESDGIEVILGKKLGLNTVLAWFQNQLSAQHIAPSSKMWQIQDRTDQNFYLKNPNIVRLINKTLNPLAVAEATMKRNAYSQTLGQKARFFDEQTATLNLNDAGMLEIAQTDPQGKKTGSLVDNDSALWTGVYVWSQALRYQTTHDPSAYTNLKRAVRALITLIDITGNPKVFARTVIVSPPSENLGPGFTQGTGEYANLKWWSQGNNDMSKGLFIGFAAAYGVLEPQDQLLRDTIAQFTRRLAPLDPIASSSFNSTLASGLVALYNHDQDALQDFRKGTANLQNQLSDALGISGGFHVGGVADWSGIHLVMISTMSELLISQQLIQEFKKDRYEYIPEYALKETQNQLLAMNKTYEKAYRYFLPIVAYAYASKDLAAQAREALLGLQEIPAPRNAVGSAVADLRKQPDWSYSFYPVTPWKALDAPLKMKSNLDWRSYAQGAYGYPAFEALAYGSNYLWKDCPYVVATGGDDQTIPHSSDYTLLYWIARSSGLISEAD